MLALSIVVGEGVRILFTVMSRLYAALVGLVLIVEIIECFSGALDDLVRSTNDLNDLWQSASLF